MTQEEFRQLPENAWAGRLLRCDRDIVVRAYTFQKDTIVRVRSCADERFAIEDIDNPARSMTCCDYFQFTHVDGSHVPVKPLHERVRSFLAALQGGMDARPKVVNEGEYQRLVKEHLPEFAPTTHAPSPGEGTHGAGSEN